jgi:hypothetical protein
VAVDGRGGAYVVGFSDSVNFPSKLALGGQQFIGGSVDPLPPAYPPQFTDAIVYKIDTTAAGEASLVYSTYLGGAGDDEARAVAFVNIAGFVGVYVAGFSGSDGERHDLAQGYPGSPTCFPDGSLGGNSPCPGLGPGGLPAAFPTTPFSFQPTHAPSRLLNAPAPPDLYTPIPADPNSDFFVAKIGD